MVGRLASFLSTMEVTTIPNVYRFIQSVRGAPQPQISTEIGIGLAVN